MARRAPRLATKVRYFGVNSAKVRRFGATKTSPPPPPPGLRSAGGPKLLKWGLPGRGSNVLKSRRPLIRLGPPRAPARPSRPVSFLGSLFAGLSRTLTVLPVGFDVILTVTVWRRHVAAREPECVVIMYFDERYTLQTSTSKICFLDTLTWHLRRSVTNQLRDVSSHTRIRTREDSHSIHACCASPQRALARRPQDQLIITLMAPLNK